MSNQVRTQNFSLGGGGSRADAEAVYDFFYFKNDVIKIMSEAQHNTVCTCIYIHTNITAPSMTQSQSPIFLVFYILLIYFSKF
jgi:hypothetical protein